MDLDAVLLSRLQFAFVVSFHIVFPAFTIGLAAWLATIEGVRLRTGNPVYRRVFDFWLRIFALSFAMGVVTGTVMAFQFGTNWSQLSERRVRSWATRVSPPSSSRRHSLVSCCSAATGFRPGSWPAHWSSGNKIG